MAAAFFVLLDGKKPTLEREREVLSALSGALSNGYTYRAIHDEIIRARQQQRAFDSNKFRNRIADNLMQQGVRYYHKELNLMNKLSPVIHDVDAGTTASSEKNVFWIEPRASYTMDDLMAYFYSKGMVDQTQYHPNRVRGILSSFVRDYGLEVTLFMIERAAAVYQENKTQFSLKTFSDYRPDALRFIEEVKNNCTYSGGASYVIRKRVLFD